MLDPKQLTAAIAMLALLTGCAGPKPDSPTTDPHGAPATGAAAVDIGARIDRYLSGMEALGLSGAIIVEHAGEVVLRKGYGLADRETGRPYTPTTVQTHGSITKQMADQALVRLEVFYDRITASA